MTATPFTLHQDVAAVEHDEAGKPVEGAPLWLATVAAVTPLSVTARFQPEGTRLFLLDSRGRAWCEAGRWRLVPLCRCERPILGEPVTAEDDPRREEFCREECRDDAGQAWAEQHYQPGVAT